MKSKYIITITMNVDGHERVLSITSYCTRSQAEKAFFALAYLAPTSNMKDCSLFLRHESLKVKTSIVDERLNHFEVKHGC